MYTSEIDQLLAKLEIEFPHKPSSRIKAEEQYKRLKKLRDYDLEELNACAQTIKDH